MSYENPKKTLNNFEDLGKKLKEENIQLPDVNIGFENESEIQFDTHGDRGFSETKDEKIQRLSTTIIESAIGSRIEDVQEEDMFHPRYSAATQKSEKYKSVGALQREDIPQDFALDTLTNTEILEGLVSGKIRRQDVENLSTERISEIKNAIDVKDSKDVNTQETQPVKNIYDGSTRTLRWDGKNERNNKKTSSIPYKDYVEGYENSAPTKKEEGSQPTQKTAAISPEEQLQRERQEIENQWQETVRRHRAREEKEAARGWVRVAKEKEVALNNLEELAKKNHKLMRDAKGTAGFEDAKKVWKESYDAVVEFENPEKNESTDANSIAQETQDLAQQIKDAMNAQKSHNDSIQESDILKSAIVSGEKFSGWSDTELENTYLKNKHLVDAAGEHASVKLKQYVEDFESAMIKRGLMNGPLDKPITQKRAEAHTQKTKELEAAIDSAKKSLQWMKGKNKNFTTTSMLMREDSKLKSLLAQQSAHVAISPEEFYTEDKSAQGDLAVVKGQSFNSVNTPEESKDKTTATVEQNNKKERRSTKGILKKGILGAALLSTLSLGNQDKQSTDFANVLETNKPQKNIAMPESNPEVQQQEPAAVFEDIAQEIRIEESIKKFDGFTQNLKRALESHPEFMKELGVPNTRPETLKKIAESIKMIDKNTGQEIRLDATTIGGNIEYVVNKDGNLVAFFNYDKNNLRDAYAIRSYEDVLPENNLTDQEYIDDNEKSTQLPASDQLDNLESLQDVNKNTEHANTITHLSRLEPVDLSKDIELQGKEFSINKVELIEKKQNPDKILESNNDIEIEDFVSFLKNIDSSFNWAESAPSISKNDIKKLKKNEYTHIHELNRHGLGSLFAKKSIIVVNNKYFLRSNAPEVFQNDARNAYSSIQNIYAFYKAPKTIGESSVAFYNSENKEYTYFNVLSNEQAIYLINE